MSLFKLWLTRLLAVQFAAVTLAGAVALPSSAAIIGVGVGTGKIQPNNALLPGLTYSMPSVAVYNKGDVESSYEMTVQYNQTQAEQKPPASWITFTPQKFTLKPGGSQEVRITVQPSSAAQPHTYFAYLEARPLKADSSGITSINVAAATKFTFEVAPANGWQRFYYMLLDFWKKNQGVLVAILSLLCLFIAFIIAKKFFRLERRRKRITFSNKL